VDGSATIFVPATVIPPSFSDTLTVWAGDSAVATSRDKLTGLVDSVEMHRTQLDPLPDEDAVTPLRTIAGPQRANSEPQATPMGFRR
jgi:hypothetical protein